MSETTVMTAAEEAHWRYQLEAMTNYRFGDRVGAVWNQVPDEVRWLSEQARYMVHLANAQRRRSDRLVSPNDLI